MKSNTTYRFAVVGPEDEANFKLFHILVRIHGKEAVARFLEPSHALASIETHKGTPLVIPIDLFGMELDEAIEFVSAVRTRHAQAVFSLYVNRDEYAARARELPDDWAVRFEHYFKLYKPSSDTDEYEPVVRASLRSAESEAQYNVTHEPIRLTPIFETGLNSKELAGIAGSQLQLSFLSYARKDWDDFVSHLIGDLTSAEQRVWCDQNYIVGGDDWMDAIGQALQASDSLLLILSPDALDSKYVKMEYRYFFHHNKPIIPVLFKKIDSLPFELATLHYIDFTQRDKKTALEKLLAVLRQHRRQLPLDRAQK